MTTQHIERSHAVALLNRAKQLVLTQAFLNNANGLLYAQGALSALQSVTEELGGAFLAHRDALLGGYQPLAGFEAAWAALPVDAKHLSLADVREFLTRHGVELAADPISNGNVDAVSQLENGVIPAVNLHDEHDAARAYLNHCASVHANSLGKTAIVVEGGAA